MITIQYGAGNQVQRNVGDFPTVGHIVRNEGLRRYFGFGDNIDVYLVGNGVLASDVRTVDGATYSLVTKAATKG